MEFHGQHTLGDSWFPFLECAGSGAHLVVVGDGSGDCLLCFSPNLWDFPSQDPWGHSPCSWCPDVPAMAPWANPLNCWPTASKLKSQRLMSTSMRWISNQISVLGGWTGEKMLLSCKLCQWECWVTSRAVKGRISFLFPTSQLRGESAAFRGSQLEEEVNIYHLPEVLWLYIAWPGRGTSCCTGRLVCTCWKKVFPFCAT